MDKQRKSPLPPFEGGRTAGETATTTNGYPKRVRLFSPDGHARRDVVTYVSDRYAERFVLAHARRIGWPVAVRRIPQAPFAKGEEGGAL